MTEYRLRFRISELSQGLTVKGLRAMLVTSGGRVVDGIDGNEYIWFPESDSGRTGEIIDNLLRYRGVRITKIGGIVSYVSKRRPIVGAN